MSMDLFLAILDRFPSALALTLAGGEPLLHPKLFEIVWAAHRRRLKVHIPTNGSLLQRNLDLLREAPVEFLNVSLYGVDGASFSAVTGNEPSVFARTVEALRKLTAGRKPGGYPKLIRTSYLCTKANLSRIADFIRLCEEIGVDQIKLKNFHYRGTPGLTGSLSLCGDDPAVQAFFEELGRQRFRVPVFLPRLWRGDVPRACTLPFRMLTIDGGGAIGPCCTEGPAPRFGGCFAEPDVWNGATLTAARRVMLDPTAPLPQACRLCEEMIRSRPSIGGR